MTCIKQLRANLSCKKFLLLALIVATVLLGLGGIAKRLFIDAPPKKHELCIMTRVKNVAYHLPQWLEFHKLSGVDHFIIANDCSDDNGATLFWLDHYAELGWISLYRDQTFNDCNNHQPDQTKLYALMWPEVKSTCSWVTITDVDEYMFPTDSRPYAANTMKSIVQTSKQPIIRMPWLIMSTHGLEERPRGLVIDNYIKGVFQQPILLKTLVQSVYVAEWKETHHPVQFEWFAPKVNGELMREYSRSFYITDKEMKSLPATSTVQPNSGGYASNCTTAPATSSPGSAAQTPDPACKQKQAQCRVPRSPIMVKHFQALSWHDYKSIRGARKKDSAGLVNNFNHKPRDMWESFNFNNVDDGCPEIAQEYRLGISEAVKEAVTSRVEQFRKYNVLHPEAVASGEIAPRLRHDFVAWLEGNATAFMK